MVRVLLLWPVLLAVKILILTILLFVADESQICCQGAGGGLPCEPLYLAKMKITMKKSMARSEPFILTLDPGHKITSMSIFQRLDLRLLQSSL